jgi:hypothetical protein
MIMWVLLGIKGDWKCAEGASVAKFGREFV